MDRKELIEQNLGLVHACANRFRGRGIEYEELYSAGCLGLVKAADGFREELGFAFSTYAVPAVLGEIRRLFRDGGAVKVSASGASGEASAWVKEIVSCSLFMAVISPADTWRPTTCISSVMV